MKDYVFSNIRVFKNDYIKDKIEVVDNEGMIFVDEEKDTMFFINETGLLIWQQIDGSTLKEIYEKYFKIINEIYDINNINDVQESFNETIDIFIENEMIVVKNEKI